MKITMLKSIRLKNMKNKKVLYLVLIALDVIITVSLLVISIIMLSQTIGHTASEIATHTGFIGYLQNHTTFYFCLFVLPLFILLAVNIIGLVIYVKRSTKAEPVQLNELSNEQKELLKKQILKDLQQDSTPNQDEKKDDK